MGRQSARLLYKKKDHKNIYFQTENENTFSGNALRMHFQMYRGSELVWEKLPPNFMLFGSNENDAGTTHAYESVTGKKFDDLGWFKKSGFKKFAPMHICKIKNKLFVCGYDTVFYSENWFSWKTLDSSIYNRETLLDIENHNEKLLIYTTKNIFLYDIDLNKKNVVYSFENECALVNLSNFDYCSSKGNTTVIGYRRDKYGRVIKLITIKDSSVVKITGTDTTTKGTFVLASNENYFILLAGAYFLTPYIEGDRYDPYTYIYSSADGINWIKGGNVNRSIYYAGIPLFFKDRFYYISNGKNFVLSSNEDGSELEDINYKIDLTSDESTLKRNFCIATDDYVYFLKKDISSNQHYLIRFKDFYSDAYETVIENSRIDVGIYSVFMNDRLQDNDT